MNDNTEDFIVETLIKINAKVDLNKILLLQLAQQTMKPACYNNVLGEVKKFDDAIAKMIEELKEE
jgi:hypothetical protein